MEQFQWKIFNFLYKKIKVNLKWEKTPKKGLNWVFQKLFQHNKFKQNISKYKRIELENSNSDFIVVQHFLAYVHSPQSPNRVRVPLSWSFNQTSNLFYTWIPALIGFYTISSRFNSLEGFNTQFARMISSQPSSIMAQIQIKAMMNHKGALKDM